MTRRLTRTRAVPVRAERSLNYPNDYLHTDRPYEQTQNDIGAASSSAPSSSSR